MNGEPYAHCAWCNGWGFVRSSIDIRQPECPCRWEEDPPARPCSLCGFDLGRQDGSHYNCRLGLGHSLDNLARNLAIAAFGQAMFKLGGVNADETWCANFDAWRPGCLRPAPGYVETKEVE